VAHRFLIKTHWKMILIGTVLVLILILMVTHDEGFLLFPPLSVLI
jgi:uncharacterized membrane protein